MHQRQDEAGRDEGLDGGPGSSDAVASGHRHLQQLSTSELFLILLCQIDETQARLCSDRCFADLVRGTWLGATAARFGCLVGLRHRKPLPLLVIFSRFDRLVDSRSLQVSVAPLVGCSVPGVASCRLSRIDSLLLYFGVDAVGSIECGAYADDCIAAGLVPIPTGSSVSLLFCYDDCTATCCEEGKLSKICR